MDPVAIWIAHLFVGGVMAASATHKFVKRRQFKEALAGYRILPAMAVAPAAILIGVGEMILGAASLTGAGHVGQAGLAGSNLVLLAYACVILTSLARGIRFIDCGCLGFGSVRRELSPAMTIRNVVVATIGSVGLLPPSGRALIWFDVVPIAGALTTLVILYAVFDLAMALSKREIIR